MPTKPKPPVRYTMELQALQRLVRLVENDGRVSDEAMTLIATSVNKISAVLQTAGEKEPVSR
jgi:hypothetical protein